MRRKSKSITLLALIVLTATPRVFDQLVVLKTSVQGRFRTELLSIFWSFTTPETQRVDAKQYSELLARAQANAPRCDSSDEIRMARAKGRSYVWKRVPSAPDLGHREPLAAEPSTENLIAAAATSESEELTAPDEAASFGKQEDDVLLARNFRDYPILDEFAAPVVVDDAAVAQFEWKSADEANATPAAQPAAFPKKALPGAERIKHKFVQAGFQIQLPENPDGMLKDVIINSDALIKRLDGLVPARTKCRVRVWRLMPEAPRPPLEKPSLIS